MLELVFIIVGMVAFAWSLSKVGVVLDQWKKKK